MGERRRSGLSYNPRHAETNCEILSYLQTECMKTLRLRTTSLLSNYAMDMCPSKKATVDTFSAFVIF